MFLLFLWVLVSSGAFLRFHTMDKLKVQRFEGLFFQGVLDYVASGSVL